MVHLLTGGLDMHACMHACMQSGSMCNSTCEDHHVLLVHALETFKDCEKEAKLKPFAKAALAASRAERVDPLFTLYPFSWQGQ